MPNWCNNYLRLEHDNSGMIARAREAFIKGKLLEEFCPIPQSLYLLNIETDSTLTNDEKRINREKIREANRIAYGHEDWYGYCVTTWGTKWDVGSYDLFESFVTDDDPNITTMSFDSAWSPPVEAMKKFINLGFKVALYYYESGMEFAGYFDENGDDCYDLTGMNADQVENIIPKELNILFGICENMRDFEEANPEETPQFEYSARVWGGHA